MYINKNLIFSVKISDFQVLTEYMWNPGRKIMGISVVEPHFMFISDNGHFSTFGVKDFSPRMYEIKNEKVYRKPYLEYEYLGNTNRIYFSSYEEAVELQNKILYGSEVWIEV